VLNIYRDTERSIGIRTTDPLPDRVIWIDLLEPTDDERKFVERQVGVGLPTREALGEIEESSRLSSEKGHLYLTMPVIGNATIEDAEVSAAGFVLGPKNTGNYPL
jgi:magnesium transporter